MENEKRYFIVFFNTECSQGLVNTITDRIYLNRNKVIKDLKESIGCEIVTLTNIKEISKEDYEQWNK